MPSIGTSPPSKFLESYPLLGGLARVYGAIAFYLDHKADIDRYLEDSAREFEANTLPLSQADPALWEKLQRAHAKMGEPRPGNASQQLTSHPLLKANSKGFQIPMSLKLPPAKAAS
jgi:hypothetical protein